MYEKLNMFQVAGAAARHAGARQAIVAENIANADTPGFQARDIRSFTDSFQMNAADGQRATRPGHIGGGTSEMQLSIFEARDAGTTSPNGNSVSLETEMFKSVETQRQHDRAMAIYKHTMTVLRTSLGRS
jgi:flagellar basal-body rod protein FlgB